MAGLGGKNWTFQEEVTSSDVNGYLADQVVMRFADSATRTAGFGGAGEPTLAEGMVSYLDDANRVDYYNGSAWKPVSQILQVVQTVKTDTFSTASTTFTDVTGLTASITPSATSSKILLIAQITVGGGSGAGDRAIFRFNGGNSSTYVGAAAGNRLQAWGMGGFVGVVGDYVWANVITGIYLDSPSSTSATTYAVQTRSVQGTNHVNRTETDTDANTNVRYASSLTAIEVAG